MPQKTREELKQYFETGDKPTQQEYADLIDSLGMPIVGEIKAVSYTLVPQGWVKCNGQLLNVATYPVLFALIGTTYGGDGVTTFAVPNLVAKVPLGCGNISGLTPYAIGQTGGEETVQLTEEQLPSHNHTSSLTGVTATLATSTSDGTTNDPTGNYLAKGVTPAAGPVPANVANIYTSTTDSTMNVTLNGNPTVENSGSNQAHSNMQPYLAVNYIIAVEGINPM